jgi:hypothetical protein
MPKQHLFKTDILSTSCGLIRFMSPITPSITTSGCDIQCSLSTSTRSVPPSLPGLPEPWLTYNPGACPARPADKEGYRSAFHNLGHHGWKTEPVTFSFSVYQPTTTLVESLDSFSKVIVSGLPACAFVSILL